MRVLAVVAAGPGVAGGGAGGRPALDPLDLALVRGDAVFEALRVYAGRPFRLREHLDRLAASAAAVELPLPGGLEELAARAVAEAGDGDAVLRLICTRGREESPAAPGPGRGRRPGGVRHLHRAPGLLRGRPAPRAPAGPAHHRRRPAGQGGLAVAAARGQEHQLRHQHGRPARGQGPRRRRRRPGRAGRRAARGPDGQPLVALRPDPVHALPRPGHPRRHHPGRALRPRPRPRPQGPGGRLHRRGRGRRRRGLPLQLDPRGHARGRARRHPIGDGRPGPAAAGLQAALRHLATAVR